MKNRNLARIYWFNQSFQWFATGLLLPVMTLVQLDKGLSLADVGLSLAIYSAMTILFELPTGGLADAIGRRRVFLTSVTVTFFAALALLLANSLIGVMFSFALLGAARALMSGTIDAWFVDTYQKQAPEEDLQPIFAKLGIFVTLALGVSSLLGGYLPQTELALYIAEKTWADQYSLNLLSIMFLMICQMGLTLWLVKEPKENHGEQGILNGLKAFPSIISDAATFGVKNKHVLALVISSSMWCFAIAGVEMLWQPQVRDIAAEEYSTVMLGYLGAGYFLFAAVGNALATPFSRLFRFNHAKLLTVMRLFMGGALIALAVSNTLYLFALCYWLLFLINGVKESPHTAMFNKAIPSDKRSTLLSFESFAMQIGGLLGSLILALPLSINR